MKGKYITLQIRLACLSRPLASTNLTIKKRSNGNNKLAGVKSPVQSTQPSREPVAA